MNDEARGSAGPRAFLRFDGRQRRSAVQVPEHDADEPCRATCRRRMRDSRPEPLAPCDPADTRTLTLPLPLTRPFTLTARAAFVEDRAVADRQAVAIGAVAGAALVTISTLQLPS